jgi:hypothetical protein
MVIMELYINFAFPDIFFLSRYLYEESNCLFFIIMFSVKVMKVNIVKVMIRIFISEV